MSNPAELALVRKALILGLGGCVEWEPKAADLIRREMAMHGLTPEGIQKQTIKHVKGGGQVHQVKEARPNWKDKRDYWYKIIIPMPDLFTKGLFVEMELFDDSPDFPEVLLVNAHEQN